EPKRKAAFGSVGRRGGGRILHVINQDGERGGDMHRAEALRLMEGGGLKLVLLRENVEGGGYRLMTGQQIHEGGGERAEKKKASPKPGGGTKELTFSSAIAKNDLARGGEQIALWIEKKHHVKITIRQAK
ncbi:IF3M factor, partial [Panurus biarmicus]|nr:IF3M factor [Panurus biarmicus]